MPACFSKLVAAPDRGSMTKAQIFELIGKLKRSELEKSQCGKRLITWYNGLKR